MTEILTRSSPLPEFLQQPETKPACEYFQDQITQKPMPKLEHSILQGELVSVINRMAKPAKLACAFPELRCTFQGISLVPDISVLHWDHIPRKLSGRIDSEFQSCPDWAIEILSPDQSQSNVLSKLLFCSKAGMELGWLVDPKAETISVVFPESPVQVYQGTTIVPVLRTLDLNLSSEQVFNWLTL
jgi:Uma2 family endonuclease